MAFIGGGFAGLSTGARLKQAGIDDVRIIEGGGDVGGAWYWNRYPGAMCDTAAMIYLPLLEETGHMPTQKYTFAPEIFEHAQRIATHFGLYDNALFSTEVTSLEWDDGSSRWIIRTDRGDEIRARFVAMGTGPLHRPKLPGIPGIETFAGHCLPHEPLGLRLHRRRPGRRADDQPGRQARRHHRHRRDRGAVHPPPGPRRRRSCTCSSARRRRSTCATTTTIDPDWFATLEPGWQREWLMNFTILQTGGFADEDLVKDGWTDISQRIRDRVVAEMGAAGGDVSAFTPEAFVRAYEESDDEKMTEIRARVDAVVADPGTAEALKPWYRQLCKRPCFHDEYLQAYNEPERHLVDTDGQGVERIDETGVWVGGVHYELDCLIFASGFEVGTDYARRSGFETIGRDGRGLSERWDDGMQSLHGIHVHGFPNLFIIGRARGRT